MQRHRIEWNIKNETGMRTRSFAPFAGFLRIKDPLYSQWVQGLGHRVSI